jgi:hypothetical protein
MGANKSDKDKLRMSLYPIEVIDEDLKVLEFGAKRYGEYNWRKGMAWTRLWDAMWRHLRAVREGEFVDPDSGLSHLAHARVSAAFLFEYIRLGIGVNDLRGNVEDVEAPSSGDGTRGAGAAAGLGAICDDSGVRVWEIFKK